MRAAIGLFSRQGLRKTSMDQIAREAGAAKPTLYAHFKDKADLYVGVCRSLGEQMEAEARALARSDRPLPERLAGMLAAKFTTVFELAQLSPHANELLQPADAAAREAIEASSVSFTAIVEQAIGQAATDGELDLEALQTTRAQLAQQLLQVGFGAGYGVTTAEQQRANLDALVASILRAGLPAP